MFEKEDGKAINQTKIRPWVKLGMNAKNEENLNQNQNRFHSSKDRLNRIQLIASGGLSSSFYDQLLYYTRQKNQLNLFGENEKSRTSELNLQLTGESSDILKRNKEEDGKTKLYEDKKDINNQSVPLHSLTKLHCDPKRNCANNQATQTTRLFNSFGLSNGNNSVFPSFIFFFFFKLIFNIE